MKENSQKIINYFIQFTHFESQKIRIKEKYVILLSSFIINSVIQSFLATVKRSVILFFVIQAKLYALLSKNKANDIFFKFLTQFTDNSIIMCKFIKYPTAIFSVLALLSFSTKMLCQNNLNPNLQCVFIEIISKIICYYQKLIKNNSWA
ncbi:hypothetical protein MXB_2342, partial [Myxobolus squamalis]